MFLNKEISRGIRLNQNGLYRLIVSLILYSSDKILNKTLCGLIDHYMTLVSNEKGIKPRG